MRFLNSAIISVVSVALSGCKHASSSLKAPAANVENKDLVPANSVPVPVVTQVSTVIDPAKPEENSVATIAVDEVKPAPIVAVEVSSAPAIAVDDVKLAPIAEVEVPSASTVSSTVPVVEKEIITAEEETVADLSDAVMDVTDVSAPVAEKNMGQVAVANKQLPILTRFRNFMTGWANFVARNKKYAVITTAVVAVAAAYFMNMLPKTIPQSMTDFFNNPQAALKVSFDSFKAFFTTSILETIVELDKATGTAYRRKLSWGKKINEVVAGASFN